MSKISDEYATFLIDTIARKFKELNEEELSLKEKRKSLNKAILHQLSAMMEKDKDATTLIVRNLYYYMPKEIDLPILCAVMGVNNRTQLARLLPPLEIPSKCQYCGCAINLIIRERKAHTVVDVIPYVEPICPNCRDERHKKYESESASLFKAQLETLNALKTMPYKDYLQTDHWKDLRNRMLKRARFKCQLCSAGGQLNVHHRTYERRGNEDFNDLIVLCANCHQKFHDKLESVK